AVVVGGVRDGGVEGFADDIGNGPVDELQKVGSVFDVLSTDQVEDFTGFGGRDPHEAELGPGAGTLVSLVDRRAFGGDANCCELGSRSGHVQPLPRTFFSWPAWNRNVRVGANSPSLWPTMDSVTYTGTCLRPS